MSFSPGKTEFVEIDGCSYDFYSNPFTLFLRANPAFFAIVARDFPSGKPLLEAMWKIECDKLIMTGFYTTDHDRRIYHMADFFGSEEPRIANWFSGEIYAYSGERWGFCGPGWPPELSEITVILNVKDGLVTSTRRITINDDDPQVLNIKERERAQEERIRRERSLEKPLVISEKMRKWLE